MKLGLHGTKLVTMMRILAATFLAVLMGRVGGSAATAQDGAGSDYDKRAQEAYAAIAAQRLKLAQDLATQHLNAWARLEYRKILFHDADHEAARAALGFKRDGATWTGGGEAIAILNDVPAGEVEKRAAAYLSRLDAIAKDAAKPHLDLAVWCEKAGLAESARWHRLEALACDPTSSGAAGVLGFRTSELLPFASDPETVEIFRAFRNDVKKVSLGETKSGDDGWGEEELKKRLKVVQGKHVGIESSWMSVDWMKELARWGDHTFEIGHKLLGSEIPNGEPRYWFAYLDDEGYKDLTMWLYRDKSNAIAERDDLLGRQLYRDDFEAQDVSRWRTQQPTAPLHNPTHTVSQFVITRRLWKNEPLETKAAAIQEGFGVLCEFMGAGTNITWCGGTPQSTVAVKKGDGQDDASHRYRYREFAGEAAETLSDSSVDALFRMRFDALDGPGTGPKAASVMEWLFARGRKDAAEFLKAMADTKDIGETIRTRFGWCPEEFDEYWRRWAIAVAKKSDAWKSSRRNP